VIFLNVAHVCFSVSHCFHARWNPPPCMPSRVRLGFLEGRCMGEGEEPDPATFHRSSVIWLTYRVVGALGSGCFPCAV
jgi:hypothetical protein